MKTIFILLLAFQLFAQNFEGIIKYQADLTGEKMDLTYYIKDDNIKMKIYDYVEGSNSALIFNKKFGKLVFILEDEKMYLELPKNSLTDNEGDELIENSDEMFENTGEKKEILGYKCEKYIVTSNLGTVSIWGTKELGKFPFFSNPLNDKKPTKWQKEMEEQNFFPLEILDAVEGSEFKVLNIEIKKLEDSEFEIPEDYKTLGMGGY